MFFICISIQANAQMNENFSDGDFLNNPAWVGDITTWKVVGFQLNNNSSTATTQSYLATQNSLAQNCQWEFYVNLKFATSSLNYADIFLVSDSSNLMGQNSGIFVRVGGTADEISLFRKDGNTIIKIIDGVDGSVSSSSNNIFKIKVTRTTNNEFKLFSDPTGTGNSYSLEGSAIETAYTSSVWCGILIKYTAANIQKFYFDDLSISTIVQDTFPPQLDSIWAIDSNQCILQLNESVDTLSVVSLTNYTLNGTISPTSAKRNSTNSSQIILQFVNNFIPNSLNTIQVRNVKDLNDNAMTIKSKSFTYKVVVNGDLVINEIFADPSPAVGMPGYEFVEIWNTSGGPINLSGFVLTDGSSNAVLPNYNLAKDSFLILCSTSSLNAFAAFGNSLMVANFPSLNNDADNLKLINAQGKLLDEANYNLTWYNNSIKSDGGWSLELINPKLRCKKKYNWNASTQSLVGGTPGKINSVYDANADTIAPQVSKFQIINDSSAWIIFNTKMDSLSVVNLTITTGVSILYKQVWNDNADSVLIRFTPLQNQVTYSFAFIGATSCNGILMRPGSFSFGYDRTFAVQFNGVVISEVYVNPVGSSLLPVSQFIELYNKSSYSINLKGMKISDGVSTTILPDYKLMKDSFILIAPSTKATEFISRNLNTLFVSSFPYLNVTDDKLYLTDSSSNLIHAMSYDVKTLNNLQKAKGGWSIEMVDPQNSCMNAGNWMYSTNTSGGTPNLRNSVNAIMMDTTKLKFIRSYSKSANEAVFIFNKSVDLKSSQTKLNFEFTPTLTGNFSLAYHQNSLNEISLVLNNAVFVSDTVYQVKINNLIDCGGKTIDSISILFGLPSIPKMGDIVINEILFDAKSYASEFIELVNTTHKIFDLNTITMAAYNRTGLSLGNYLLSEFPLQILPQQYISIATDANNIKTNFYSKASENIFTNSEWKSLDDDSGIIIIANINSLDAIDTVYYSKNWHHPFITNNEGVSLERMDFLRDGKAQNNWQSAASSAGFATPAYLNSKYGNAPQKSEFVNLSQTYLTPDNDGVDDELNFTILLDTKNYSITITLFDINGNEIKILARNDIAANTNYYSWDGRTNEGTLANTGHYILMIQAMDGNGEIKASKQVVDLLMR